MNYNAPSYKILLVGETKLKWNSLYHIRDREKTLVFFETHVCKDQMLDQSNSKWHAIVKSTEIEVNTIKLTLSPDDTIEEILKTLYKLLSS